MPVLEGGLGRKEVQVLHPVLSSHLGNSLVLNSELKGEPENAAGDSPGGRGLLCEQVADLKRQKLGCVPRGEPCLEGASRLS